ncbi:zinc knuckle, partial [Ostertagia ostertagi]
MSRECKAEQRTNKVVALGALKRLKKRDNQNVSDFCVELEQLTRQAYPELDERTLAVERAHLLYDQLVHWRDSYYLLEALECEQDAYEKLKEVAKRIERRNLTLKQAKEHDPGEKRVHPKSSPEDQQEHNRKGTRSKTTVCYKCHDEGHMARDCGKIKTPAKQGSSLSNKLRGDRSVTAKVHSLDSTKWPKEELSPLFGKKMAVELEILGVKARGLLDTGSEISIIPGDVLLRAKQAGCDIDKLLVEHEIDRSKRVYDASGGAMQFVTVVEVPIHDCSSGRQVRALVHVTKVKNDKDDMVILGTNVLSMLGYRLNRRNASIHDTNELRERGSQSHTLRQIPRPRTAKVAQRGYVAPGAMTWVKLSGCSREADWMLDSSMPLIHSGVCRAEENGLVEVPVVNSSSEPVVLRTGEQVGQWKQHKADWTEASVKDVPTDMLSLETKELSPRQRLGKLRQFLKENRRDGTLSSRLWNLVKDNHSVFAVEDKELTQTSLVKHEIRTGDTEPIRQRTRPVP